MNSLFRATLLVVFLPIPSLRASPLFVSQTSTTPVPPYGSWATAATNIQQAVDASAPGDFILVSNGVYVGPVVITRPVWVLSYFGARGAQYTVIDGQGTNQCVWMTNNTRLDGFTITHGWAQNGGGIWCASSNAFVTNCIIVGNVATNQGGGVWGGTVGQCTLSGNSAPSGGGAASALLENTVVSNNTSTVAGGGVFQCGLNNCLLTGNNSAAGGGAFGGMLSNCTLSENQANSGGGAESAILNNSIIYLNSAPTGENTTNCTLNYCDTTPLPDSGSGNIDADPVFVDVVGGNFRLLYTSPCINAGSNALVVDPADWELDGNPRISGGRVDMGAYEFQGAAVPVVVTQPQSQTVYSGSDVTFTASADGAPPLSWQWQFDGIAIQGATTPTLMLSQVTTNQSGNYTVAVTNSYGFDHSQVATLTVQDSAPIITMQPQPQAVAVGGSVTFSADAVGSLPLFWQWQFHGNAILNATNSSLVLGPVTTDQQGPYSVIVSNAFGVVFSSDATLTVALGGGTSYVWQNSPSPTPPYTNWATAAHSIGNALNSAAPLDTIVVTNGTYPGPVNIDQPLALVSVNGPKVTLIDGGSVTLVNQASLSGFTVSNGGGAGVSCFTTNAFVTNCVISGNQAWGSFGGGANGCTLVDCLLMNNMATNGGGAYASTLINCVVSNNAGGGVSWCSVFNTLIISNTAYGDGADSSTLYNCILIGNGNPNYYWNVGAYGSTLYNCTLSANTLAASASRLYNCIAYYSTAAGGTNYDPSCTLHYCCTTPMPTNGVGNITNAPLFVSPDTGDFHLLPTSPCIDAGDNTYALTSTDFDGNPRIANGTVDMGAYEYQGTSPMTFQTWLAYYGLPTDGSADFLDSDGDGMNNWQEWIAGTNPTNAASALRILSASSSDSGVVVTWQSITDRSYYLQRATDLGGTIGFLTVATNIVGLTNTTIYIDSNAIGSGPFFYRVGIPAP